MREATYHLSLVSTGVPYLLSSWEALIYLLPHGLTAIAQASETLGARIEESLQQRADLPPIQELQAARNILTRALATARSMLEPLQRVSGPIFWVSKLQQSARKNTFTCSMNSNRTKMRRVCEITRSSDEGKGRYSVGAKGCAALFLGECGDL